MNIELGAVGWHGKLPALNDFASRRLDAKLIEQWDGQLSRTLGKVRREDETGWLKTYLASPTWRFLISSGFLPCPFNSCAWVGILMPSVDRVGRYYPLTLISPLTDLPTTRNDEETLCCWLQNLEDIAVDALQQDWSIDQLDEELFKIGLPPKNLESASPSDIKQIILTPSVEVQSHLNSDLRCDPRFFDQSSCSCVWCCQTDIETVKVSSSDQFDKMFDDLWA